MTPLSIQRDGRYTRPLVNCIFDDDTIFGIATDAVLGPEEPDKIDVRMCVQIIGRGAKAAVDPRVVGDQADASTTHPCQFIIEEALTTETDVH